MFIYIHNAARSQIAEAFLNEMAAGRYLGISAGSQPAERVNPGAVKVVAELGIDISGRRPKRLAAEMVERADVVVIMGCGEEVCPVVPKVIQDWRLEDPEGQPLEAIRRIRDQIKRRVEQLIEALDSGAVGTDPRGGSSSGVR